MIRCCVFDADGTLLDSMPMWRDITYEYAEQKGVHAPAGLHNTLNRLSLEQCAQHYQGLGVRGTVEEIVKELGQCALRATAPGCRKSPTPGNFAAAQENRIPVAVATASNREGVLLALERLGMLPLVDYFTTCTEVGKAKNTRTSSPPAPPSSAPRPRRRWSLRTPPTPSARRGQRASRWWRWRTPSPPRGKPATKPGRAWPAWPTWSSPTTGS